MFTPKLGEDEPIFDSSFSMGLVQPPPKSWRFVNDQILSLLCCTSHPVDQVEVCGSEQWLGFDKWGGRGFRHISGSGGNSNMLLFSLRKLGKMNHF